MDYSNRTVAELKKLCKERGIKPYSNKKRGDLVSLLQQYDATPIPPPFEMTSAVLELCPIPESVNIDQMKEYINDYMSPSRIQFHRDTKRMLYIEDEFSEYYVSKCTNGTMIGGGHCAMDVKTQNNEGIDATCIILNKSQSNEKSLIQNFISSGGDLDTLFKDRKDTEAVKLFMSEYSKKLQDVKKGMSLHTLYILAFVSSSNDIFLACFKINIENIPHVLSGGFVKNSTSESVNITVNNFIDPSYGKVNLYKSKKRVELRLLPPVLKNEYAVKIYTMPQISP